jgi:hypothetical protein
MRRAPSFPESRSDLIVALAMALVCAGMAKGQPPAGNNLPNPKLLTLTPCGAKAGTTLEVSFSGADLEEPQTLLFSHSGIKAEPIIPPPPPAPKPDPKKPAPKPDPKQPAPKTGAMTDPARQPITKFKVTVGTDVPVGIYDARLIGRWGISNPRAFVVGDLNEVAEKEPNNDLDQAQRVDLNTTINGVIAAPTDVDYFVFTGKKAQRIIISCLASSIDSRLQPALELYDSGGQRLAFNRHYQDYDALMDCTLPADGDYYIRLYEFTYTQGSGEYFYRLSISTAPWIDAVYPPMVEPGKATPVTIYGRNLPDGKLDPSAVVNGRVLEKVVATVTATSDPAALMRLNYSSRLSPLVSSLDGFEYRVRNSTGASNPFLLTYSQAPIVLDNEANDTPETAQSLNLPCEIAGRIEKKNDEDWYSFTAKKGEIYNFDLFSERIGGQTDIYFILRNASNNQDIGEFDDEGTTLTPIKFFTRTADPPTYRFAVPADGKYLIKVASRDSAFRAGPRCYYRLRIIPDRPDFRLIVMPPGDEHPDACRLLQNGHEYFTVLVWREGGFNGPITLSAEGLPAGVTCVPQTVGPGIKQSILTFEAAPTAAAWAGEFKVKGTATINGQTAVREARPASVTWPVPIQQGIPTVTRLDRSLVLAVREKAPFQLSTKLDKTVALQGEKVPMTLKLTRLWPDFKAALQVTYADPIPSLTVNNNQPITVPADKNEAKVEVNINAGVAPGTYNLELRGSAQIPFNKDPMAKQKPNVNVLLPAAPTVITVLPKQVATLSLVNAAVTGKPGTQSEVVIKVARQQDYNGEFKVQLVVPQNIKGVSADEVTIAAGQNEGKLIVKIAGDAAPGNRPDLIVRATAMQNGNVPTPHETKLSVNVVK